MISLDIQRNYLTTWFLVDLLGTFPFEKLIKGEATSRKSLKLIKYFKIPKLLRVSRVMKYVRDHKQVYDIFQVFVLVFTFLHLGACFWMLVVNPCADLETGGIELLKTCAQDNIYNLYAESFHISAAMMLGVSNFHIIGNSTSLDVLAQRRETDQVKMYVVSTLYMIGGLCLIALLISQLNVFLFGKKQGSAAFQRKIDRVGYEMEYYGIPDEIQRQVKAFYDYIWIHQKQYDDKIALLSDDQMSTDLQRKLALHLFKDVVSHISLFSEIDDLLLGEICLSLRTRIFLPQDMILFKGDVGKELFIIAKGVVEVLRDDLPISQRQIAPPILLRNGSFFGEIALIMESRRTCSVQARTICETNILRQNTFDTILKQNPDFARRMNELVVARQLERSLMKSERQGDEVRVSHIDMANALSVVEKNMKKGLERRLQQQSCLHHARPPEVDSSPNRVKFHSNQNSSSPIDITSQNDSHMKKNEEHRNSNILKNMRSTFRLSLSSAHNDTGGTEVSKIIDDIARRSTRHINLVEEIPDRQRKRTNTNGSNDVEAGQKPD
jgi:CRP-like cAMP-binding protein